MSTWRPYNTVLMRSELTKTLGNANIVYSGNPEIIQSAFGIRGNFEVLCCFKVVGPTDAREPPFGGGGSVHLFRNNDHSKLPWSNFTPITTFPPSIDNSRFLLFENLALIQINFGSANLDKPANLEVIGRIGDKLKHICRESRYPFYWKQTSTFLRINNSYDLTEVTGNPSLIQGTFGIRHMNFELTVPLIKGGIYHLFKVNDGDNPSATPWQIGNHGKPIDHKRKYEAVSLIQSNFQNNPASAGNLEMIARSENGLFHFWMDSKTRRWNGPFDLSSFG